MANLAIKGHPTRGREVVEILEMLGGKNNHNYGGTFNECYIIDYNEISTIYTSTAKIGDFIIFTLEEFLEKYPYKIGDSVSRKYLKNYKIEKAEWESCNNRVIYKLQGMGWYSVEELQPYKEETMETITIDDFKANTKEWLIDKLHGMIINDAIKTIGDIHDELHKPKYPKTYKECCDVLGLNTMDNDAQGYKGDLIIRFQELLICRDAYWKIAGEEMGFGKPWIYDISKEEFSYAISYSYGGIQKNEIRYKNAILIFPTKEMRDTFYENFKDLVEECKEFL